MSVSTQVWYSDCADMQLSWKQRSLALFSSSLCPRHLDCRGKEGGAESVSLFLSVLFFPPPLPLSLSLLPSLLPFRCLFPLMINLSSSCCVAACHNLNETVFFTVKASLRPALRGECFPFWKEGAAHSHLSALSAVTNIRAKWRDLFSQLRFLSQTLSSHQSSNEPVATLAPALIEPLAVFLPGGSVFQSNGPPSLQSLPPPSPHHPTLVDESP